MKTGFQGARLGVWLIVAASAAGCGGKAVVDPTAGAGGQGASGGGHATGGNPLCATPEPVGALEPCGSGSGAGSCWARLCDELGNQWESSCTPTGCACRFNGETRCSCVGDGPAQFCDGVTLPCCPTPFP